MFRIDKNLRLFLVRDCIIFERQVAIYPTLPKLNPQNWHPIAIAYSKTNEQINFNTNINAIFVKIE